MPLYQLILFTLHLSLFQRCSLLQTPVSNLHLDLHVSLYSMCHVSLVLGIRLKTLTFNLLTTSGTLNIAYRLLILLQLPLHLLTLRLHLRY